MKNFSYKNILVVEDEDVNFIFINLILTNNHFNVLRACTGTEAVMYVKNNTNIDLILMDIELPELNGWGAILQIKKIDEKLPIIVQTAFNLKEYEKRCFEMGCQAFIAKPYNANDLLAQIKKYLK